MKISCKLCNSEFRPALPGFEDDETFSQGLECATFFSAGRIYGAYGSYVHDGNLFEYTGDIPESILKHLPNDTEEIVVCDSCVTNLVEENKITLVASAHHTW